jgi:hypothetical protein
VPQDVAESLTDDAITEPVEAAAATADPAASARVPDPSQYALPGIESYPGFVTEAKVKRSRWFGKATVGVGAGLTGLIIGLASAGDTEAAKDDAEKDAQAKIARIQGQTDDLVAEAKQEALADEQEAIDEAVTAAVAEEKARRAKLVKKAVAEAVKETKADLKAAAEPKTLASSTDPRFDTCGAANAAGYGNYRRGSDPEYEWYDDRDNDGVVCE